MEPKFQSSFIPKKPVSDSAKMLGPVTKNRNIFSVLATFIFTITLLVSAGLFVYQKMIESKISKADLEISDVRNAFEADKIRDLIDASSRLNSITKLLENHYVVSEVLILLQNLTVRNMRFDNFSYRNTDGKPTISMDSEALSYNAVANQRDVFIQSGLMSDVLFTGFNLSETGQVRSKFTAVISPKLVSYKELIDSLTKPNTENTETTETESVLEIPNPQQ